jgi:hypothetical protein
MAYAPYQNKSTVPYISTIAGRIVLGASGAVGSTVGLDGVTVAKSGTGTYTLTLNEKFALALGIQLTSSEADVELSAEWDSANNQWDITTSESGAAANGASGDEIYVAIHMTVA